jgi:putative flavoprotein involved in K+ transport
MVASERIQTVVIGAGQSGLSAGYYLAQQGLPFVILDANARVGDSWRRRWDSLRLFTPARFDTLPGMRFPAHPRSFPTKDQMADYLEAYAKRFALPVRSGAKVERVSRHGRLYIVETADRRYEAEHVIVAMANYQVPKLPPFSSQLRPDIVQLHSIDYRNPSQLRPGPVLLVGAGNSGSEIAMELSRTHQTLMSGRDTGHVPVRIETFPSQVIVLPILFRLIFHRLLTVRTAFGRKARAKMLSQGGPLIRVKPADLAAAHVERIPRVTGVRNGLPVLEDGRVLDVANVVWCSGFQPGFSWIDLPVFDENGRPRQDRGAAENEPGLYFLGLHFLYSMSSSMIHGVSRDAARIARIVRDRARADARGVSPALASAAPAGVSARADS